MSTIYLPFDTETGGLDAKKEDLLTFYMAVMDENFQILEELDLKLKPEEGFPVANAGALEVNGINIQKHMEDPRTIKYSEAKPKIMAMLKRYLKKKGKYSNLRPIGHNVDFDINWVQEKLIPKAEWDLMVHYAKIDTKLYIDFLKDCGWFPRDLGTLGSIVDYLQLPKRSAHSAKEDTLMCVDAYKKILEIMRSKKDGGNNQDLISLLEAE